MRRTMEFHVSRSIRDACAFDQSLFVLSGNVILPDFQAARNFAAKFNATKSVTGQIKASELNAMGLIDELLHALVAQYRSENANVFARAIVAAQQNFGAAALQHCLENFTDNFPPLLVYRNQFTTKEYLAAFTDGAAHTELALEEMLMLHMANLNPAFAPFRQLFDDTHLNQNTIYTPLMQMLEHFFEREPGFELAGGISLWRALRAPAIRHPNSLSEQLKFLLRRFGVVLERMGAALALRFKNVKTRVQQSLGFLQEESRPAFVGFGPPQIGLPHNAKDLAFEPENFTPDKFWMPELVLVAKNALVWLNQLSKRYNQNISRLDQIPNQELLRLRSQGITGIWLIGLWKRSNASRKIKNMMGNPDAAASAYSLLDYTVSEDLGGDAACDDLQTRAWQHGIRIGSDMVPNHTGIDSVWVHEHPEYFLQLQNPPYPSYSFEGQNVSEEENIKIFLEDGYYNHSDAAVVFKRVASNGFGNDVRYIYHGNDGTGLPWNDTAQLDYLKREVRDAVRQEIVRVAQRFPIVRFDAAMTLAKKHVRRLWYPAPGDGGAIATRSEHALSQEDFDAAMPEEFWREVVETCAAEAPDTLLLAEAFWMMEGYFVRSLGMHRVYNSAFMHMLRDEKNVEYKKILTETLALEPEILKRFVNFLNNPDEETAAQQFGKGDKYFGIMTLCAALPGLPMIGHGQFEGLEEKYGMEYRRALSDEQPDAGFTDYHESQIFPLLQRRALFAEVENFAMLNFEAEFGSHDNVYAFSNRRGTDRALVIYNNAPTVVRGHLRQGNMGRGRKVSLAQALGLEAKQKHFAIWREQVSNLEFLAPANNLSLYFELAAYGRKVLLDWREVWDEDGRYEKLWRELKTSGVNSVEEALRGHALLQLHVEPAETIVATGVMQKPKTEKAKLEKIKTAKVNAVKTKAMKPEAAVPKAKIPKSNTVKSLVVRAPKTTAPKTTVVKTPAIKTQATKAPVGKTVASKPQLAKSNLSTKVSVTTVSPKTVVAKPVVAKTKTLQSKKVAAKKVVAKKATTKKATAKRGVAEKIKVVPDKPVEKIIQSKLTKNPSKKLLTKKPVVKKNIVKKSSLKKIANKKTPDDLTIINGIGPKIAKALRAAGMNSFVLLSKASEKKLRGILEAANIRVAPSLPLWPQRATKVKKQ